MQIQSTLELRNNRATSTTHVWDFTGLEAEKIQQYGAFLVEVGGVIEGFYGAEYISFTLPGEQRCIYDGFPLTKYFDLSDYADAEKRAHVYAKVIESRIRGARADLLAKTTILPGDRTYEVTETAALLPEYQSESGTEALPQAAAHSFNLGTVFAVPPNQFLFSVTNEIDAEPLAITASVKSYDMETQLLTVDLSPEPTSGNYVLAYTVSVV